MVVVVDSDFIVVVAAEFSAVLSQVVVVVAVVEVWVWSINTWSTTSEVSSNTSLDPEGGEITARFFFAVLSVHSEMLHSPGLGLNPSKVLAFLAGGFCGVCQGEGMAMACLKG